LSFFNELKRRNVFKVTIAYVVVAWLLAQVLQLVFESFGTPDWVMKTVLVLMAAGLAFAIFFAWAFELTPEGLKREHEVDRTQSITPQTGKKLNTVIFTVMALALAYFAYDKFILTASRDAALVESTTQAMKDQPGSEDVSAETDNSIAVLPFADMSPDKDQDYFSDGLSEELLNLLAKIPELRVAARTSSFQFKGQTGDIADIGRQLKVAHVLEGSVRTAGDRVRVTAQLIHAEDGYHLWSETYDRTLDDIFAIQDEIANEVVAQLKITLLGKAPKVLEADPEAYALYLQGRHMRRELSTEMLEQAIDHLQRALTIDPNYAAAWNELGSVYTSQANLGLRPVEEGFKLRREAINKALAIDPEYAPAHASLGLVALANDNDLAAAAQHIEHALQLEPGNIQLLNAASVMLESLNRLDQAIKLTEYVVVRDPVNAGAHSSLSMVYASAGRFDEAISSAHTALTLSPTRAQSQFNLGKALLLKGEPQAALEAMSREETVWRMIGLPLANHALGQADEADAVVAELIEQYEQGAPYNIAYIMAWRGEADRAFEWLDKAVEFKDGGLSEILTEPLFNNIHEDPRWLPFLESVGKSPEQLASIEFEVTLPE
jgi:TolB-like protein/Flp pilus assembly protein TadD